MNVVVLGASEKADRYSNKAQRMLAEHGHRVFPVSPTGKEILGNPGYRSILEVPEAIHTVTLYLNPVRLEPLVDEIVASKPQRVIFNPGTESANAADAFSAAGIQVVEACTLVLLQLGQFGSA